MRELFKSIRDADGKIILASCSDEAGIKEYETIARIEELVEKCASSDDAQKTKPAPDIFEAALRNLGNPPKDLVVVIGDSPDDAIAATRAGLRIAGVLCGGFSEADLKSHGCFTVFRDPADILENLPSFLKHQP